MAAPKMQTEASPALVALYGRVKPEDKRRLEQWAAARGMTTSTALALALPKGLDFLETWE